MKNPMILIVDDDLENVRLLGNILERNNYDIAVAINGKQAPTILEEVSPDLILLDIMMPELNGFELCRILKGLDSKNSAKYPFFGKAKNIPVIFQTAKTDVDDIVKGFESGAVDYITKPFNSAELLARISAHVNLKITRENLKTTKKNLHDSKRQLRATKIGLPNVIAESEQMREVVKKAKMFHKAKDIPILLEGESGTGKEIVARLIHYGTGNIEEPFVGVNSAVLPKELFESELFGYEPGAFTGADKKGKQGYFELAEGGTIFLDEIGEMPINLQPKLLRILQDRTYYKLGGNEELEFNARVISATNKNLHGLLKENKFRIDLFHRLSVGYIYIPPLRERKEDIKSLAVFFLNAFAERNSMKPKTLEKNAMQKLIDYEWPGNIRELENVLRIADFMSSGSTVSEKDIEFKTHLYYPCSYYSTDNPGNCLDLDNITLPGEKLSINDLNDRIFQLALERFNGSATAAANYLGVTRQTVHRFAKNFKTKES